MVTVPPQNSLRLAVGDRENQGNEKKKKKNYFSVT